MTIKPDWLYEAAWVFLGMLISAVLIYIIAGLYYNVYAQTEIEQLSIESNPMQAIEAVQLYPTPMPNPVLGLKPWFYIVDVNEQTLIGYYAGDTSDESSWLCTCNSIAPKRMEIKPQ